MAGKTLQGVEVFAAGTFYPGNLNGAAMEFTEADLDDIVAAFAERASAGRAPLKLGHNDDQPVTDGQPALGWVQRVWRDGAKLLADFSDMPVVVYDAIKNGLYKYVSVELSRDVETSGGLRRWALDAAALLGADIPAVGTLKDLQALTMSARGGLRPAVVFSLTQAKRSNGDHPTMSEEEKKQLAELQAKFSALQTENAALKAKDEAREAQLRKEKVERTRADIRAQFKTAEDAQRVRPYVQSQFVRSRDFTDDERVLAFSADVIETIIKEHEVPESERKTSGKATTGSGGKGSMSDQDEARFAALPKDAAIIEAREKVAAEQGLDLRVPEQFDRATRVAFRKYPELATAYYKTFDEPNSSATA